MKHDTLRKILTFCIVLYPITSVYGYEKINFGMISFMIIILFLILKKGITMEFPKYMWMFIFYIIFTRFIWSITVSFLDIVPVTVIGFFITLGFACKYLDLRFSIKIYRIVGFLSCVFFIIQEITFALWGHSISGLLPNVPLVVNVDFDYREFLSAHFRQSSFFREPAYFAQFLLPLLIIELFNDQHKTKLSYPNAFFITIVIFLSASGSGFVGLIVIWVSWLIFELKRGFQLKKIFILISIVSVILIYGSDYILSDKGKILSHKIEGATKVDESSISSFQRVFRGYYVYDEYNIFEKIVGINNPKLQLEKVQQSSVRLTFGNELYFNGIQSLLILTGLIGLGLMLLSYKTLWIKNSNTIKVLLFTFIAESFIEAIFINAAMLLYITFLYSFYKQHKANNLKNNLVE